MFTLIFSIVQGLIISISPSAVSNAESPRSLQHNSCSISNTMNKQLAPVSATVEVFLRRSENSDVEVISVRSEIPFMDALLKERLMNMNIAFSEMDTSGNNEFSVILTVDDLI